MNTERASSESNPRSLQAPWRLEYLEAISKSESDVSAKSVSNSAVPETTFLAEYWNHPERDEVNNVIARTESGMILLNAFPYSNGHLLVALGTARARLIDYTPEERAALWKLTDYAAVLMHEALEPQGINIGVNEGRAAGAGVPSHLHVHLVPRWSGDVNFMTVVGNVRVIGGSLEAMARRYRAARTRLGEVV